MIVAIHVAIAVLSIIITTAGYIKPTSTILRAGYAFIGLTFASGFYLVWNEPAKMLHTCMSGLTYLAVVSVVTFLARRKLAILQSENPEAVQEY